TRCRMFAGKSAGLCRTGRGLSIKIFAAGKFFLGCASATWAARKPALFLEIPLAAVHAVPGFCGATGLETRVNNQVSHMRHQNVNSPLTDLSFSSARAGECVIDFANAHQRRASRWCRGDF